MNTKDRILNPRNLHNYNSRNLNKTTNKERVLMKYIDIAIENREFEIRHYWIRTAFFGGIVAIAFTALTSKGALKSTHWKLFFSSIGLVCSFCWILANLGSKYWQRNWEKKADILTNNYFSTIEIKEEFNLTGGMRYSVSKLITLLSYFSCLCWYFLLTFFSIKAINNFEDTLSIKDILTLAGILGTHIILVIIALLARSGEKTKKDKIKSKQFKEIGSLLQLIKDN